ncbi:MAG TPA: hypothetical protein VFY83_05445, partial [Anaerolineales bacterium]|nr:hypothetical protein [Anaerolineales bacterium]
MVCGSPDGRGKLRLAGEAATRLRNKPPVDVLYSLTQYYAVVGLAAALCPYPDIVARDNRNIWVGIVTVHFPN